MSFGLTTVLSHRLFACRAIDMDKFVASERAAGHRHAVDAPAAHLSRHARPLSPRFLASVADVCAGASNRCWAVRFTVPSDKPAAATCSGMSGALFRAGILIAPEPRVTRRSAMDTLQNSREKAVAHQLSPAHLRHVASDARFGAVWEAVAATWDAGLWECASGSLTRKSRLRGIASRSFADVTALPRHAAVTEYLHAGSVRSRAPRERSPRTRRQGRIAAASALVKSSSHVGSSA